MFRSAADTDQIRFPETSRGAEVTTLRLIMYRAQLSITAPHPILRHLALKKQPGSSVAVWLLGAFARNPPSLGNAVNVAAARRGLLTRS